MTSRFIPLRVALKDFLREQGLSLSDLLEAMDETPEGVIESLLKRVDISYEEAARLERIYGSRQLNLLIFAIQVFYYVNVSGYYKGYVITPLREEVVNERGKITREGLIKIIRSLGLRPRWATVNL